MKKLSEKARFIVFATFLALFTIFLAYHFVNLLLVGDNSLKVYNSLKYKKVYLESENLRLQQENARLQKEYFELKNLEPEE